MHNSDAACVGLCWFEHLKQGTLRQIRLSITAVTRSQTIARSMWRACRSARLSLATLLFFGELDGQGRA